MKRFRPVWDLLEVSDKRRLLILATTSSGLALLEMVGVTMVFPLILVFATPPDDEVPTSISRIMDLTGLQSADAVAGLLVCLILLVLIARGIGSVLVFRSTLKLSLHAEARMAERLLRAFLNASLLYHLSSNSAAAQRTINESLREVYQKGLVMVIPALGDIAVVALVSMVVIIIAPVEAGVGALCLGAVVVLYRRLAGRRAEYASAQILDRYRDSFQYIQQSLGAVKEIQLRGAMDFFTEDMLRVRTAYAEQVGRIQTIEYLPRYLLELGMIVSAAVVGVVSFTRNPPDRALAVVSIFAAAVVRVLPSLNRVMVASMHLTSIQPSLRLVYEALGGLGESAAHDASDSHPLEENEPFEELTLANIAFSYPGSSGEVLRGVELTIGRGEYLGIIGPSGTGKTTLLNLLLGLLDPSEGQVLINGVDIANRRRSWQNRIGYVPQDVAFIDDSIAANVAFGVPISEIDRTRVLECLTISQLDELVATLPDGMDTSVREAGKGLSGGQRQRVGLARALYHEPDVLVLDEATSALDGETEAALLDAIDRLSSDITIIVVAHRQSTVTRCSRVITLGTTGVVSETA